MEVAIMGAGLSGLACAITLERLGIQPTIFEKRSEVGDRFVCGEAFLNILNRPIDDVIKFLSEEHNINLYPISNITEIDFYSENKKGVLKGNLGYSNVRGRHKDSFEKQLESQVKSKIKFNSNYSYENLQKEFTHVVLATGDGDYALKNENYRKDLTISLKGATITGNFNIHHPSIWFNNKFSPKAYSYLIPFSEKEANIVLTFPEYQETKNESIDVYWDRFFQRVCKDFNQNFKITDNFEINGYIAGVSKLPRIGNTFYVGNCFGGLMPGFGFGQFPAILTGIFAARDICGVGDCKKLTNKLYESYDKSLTMRRAMEQLDNNDFDRVVEILNLSISNKMFNYQRLDFFSLISGLIKPWVKFNDNKF